MNKEERRIYNKHYYELRNIYREKCCLCNKNYIPWGYNKTDKNNINYIDVKRGHVSCLKLLDKKNKINDARINNEYLIFSKIQEID